MRLWLIVCAVLVLTGCAVPVARNFPDIPPALTTSCDHLTLVAEGTEKLSEVLIVVTENYAKYHQCQIKVETWQQWYRTQKDIFDSVR